VGFISSNKFPRRFFWPFFLASFCGALVLFVLAIYGFAQNQVYSNKSCRSVGVVTQKFSDLTIGKYGLGGMSTYLAYSYRVGVRQYFSPVLLVPAVSWNEVQVRGPIPIKYLIGHPDQSRIDSAESEQMDALRPWGAAMIGSLLFFLSVGIWHGGSGKDMFFDPPSA
jgi:hypothetical protein